MTHPRPDNPVRILRTILEEHGVPFDAEEMARWEKLCDQPVSEKQAAEDAALGMAFESRRIIEGERN